MGGEIGDLAQELVFDLFDASPGPPGLVRLHLSGTRRYSTGVTETFEALLTPNDARGIAGRVRGQIEGELKSERGARGAAGIELWLEAFALGRVTAFGVDPSTGVPEIAFPRGEMAKLYFLGRRSNGRQEVFQGILDSQNVETLASGLEQAAAEAERAGS
jgi:hypothetical protein